MDPHDKTNKCNEHIRYDFKESNPKNKHYGHTMSSKMPDLDTVDYCVKTTSYMNTDLIYYAEECVNEGFKLFGENYLSFWD
jgi:hypothetical protein